MKKDIYRVDLHTHTHYSDGYYSPALLLNYAKKCNIDLLSLTDHDTVIGVNEAMLAAKDLGIEFIPGVEISASWMGQTIHVLGLRIDVDNADLKKLLARNKELRLKRALSIADLLEKKGVKGATHEVQEIAKQSVVGRGHFANILVKQGFAKSYGSAFKHYLSKDQCAYVPIQWPSLEEVVSTIKKASGISALAHAHRYHLGVSKLNQLIKDFYECGGEAMELPMQAPASNLSKCILKSCMTYDFLVTVGSDYHGPTIPGLPMGIDIRELSSHRYVWDYFRMY